MVGQTFKNFGINFNMPPGVNTFSSGDQVTGQISFELTKETKINSITMALKGFAHVHWSSGSGGKKRSKRHYSARVEFFKLKSVILQEDGVVRQPVNLQPGVHVYPFTCHIPQGDFPSTFHGAHGQILYRLEVGILRPWHMSKEFMTELKFVSHVNVNDPLLRAPLSGTNSTTLCCLWCASGPITMTVSTEKKAFMPGETVKIHCECSNASDKIATPKVKLLQKQSFFTHNKRSRRIVEQRLVSLTGDPFSPHTSDAHSQISLVIPATASLTISNCSILTVDYTIEVSLKIRHFADVTVLFPIIISGTPVETLSPFP